MTLPPFPVSLLDDQLSLTKFILPLKEDAAHLPRCLGSLDTICHLESLAHEIVAVDDDSRDGTAAEARRYAHFMPLWLIRHGRSQGRSFAFRTALESACREVSEEDLLMPVDPRHPIHLQTALRAIAAARAGHDAVLALPPSSVQGRASEPAPQHLCVYRARTVKRHLRGFLASQPAVDEEPLLQLERYLASAGVSFRWLTLPLAGTLACRFTTDDARSLSTTAGLTQ